MTLAAMIAIRRREILEVSITAQSAQKVGVPVSIRIKHLHGRLGRQLLVGSLALGAAATVAACGSSSSSGAAAGSSRNWVLWRKG